MRALKLKTDGRAITGIKQVLLAVAILFTFLPVFIIFWSDLTV